MSSEKSSQLHWIRWGEAPMESFGGNIRNTVGKNEKKKKNKTQLRNLKYRCCKL